MMDFHVLTPAGPELLMYVVDGMLVIVPAPDFVGRSQNELSNHAGFSEGHLPTNSSSLVEKSKG